MHDVEYAEGDEIEVKMPSGWMHGTVKKIMPDYAWTGDTYYEITGKEMITIAPARVMRRAD